MDMCGRRLKWRPTRHNDTKMEQHQVEFVARLWQYCFLMSAMLAIKASTGPFPIGSPRQAKEEEY